MSGNRSPLRSINSTLLSRMLLNGGAKTVAVKTANGTEETFRLAGRAGKDIGEGAEKSGKVTVYYTEEAGHKVAHFFKKSF